MILLILCIAVFLLCFGGVIFFGAPYLPTLTPQVKTALELADLKSGEHLLELGCGDGKVLIAAAEKEIVVTGYELNPILAAIAWARTRRYRQYVTIIWGDFWKKDWPRSDAIFVFLLPRYMKKLDKKIMQSSNKHVKLVSFAFTIPNKTPTKVKDGIHLYRY